MLFKKLVISIFFSFIAFYALLLLLDSKTSLCTCVFIPLVLNINLFQFILVSTAYQCLLITQSLQLC